MLRNQTSQEVNKQLKTQKRPAPPRKTATTKQRLENPNRGVTTSSRIDAQNTKKESGHPAISIRKKKKKAQKKINEANSDNFIKKTRNDKETTGPGEIAKKKSH